MVGIIYIVIIIIFNLGKGVTAGQLLHYHHEPVEPVEPVEPDAKFPDLEDKKMIVQHAGLHANYSYLLLASCTYEGAATIRYLSFKPRRLFKPLIKPQNEDKCTPWEFTSPSSDGNFTLHSQDQSGTWYFALSQGAVYPDKDSRHAALLGFQPVPNGDSNEFQVYHHDQERNKKVYLIMNSDGKSITLSESSEASRWQVVPHDPKTGTHGVECHLYRNVYDKDHIHYSNPGVAVALCRREVAFGFDENIQLTDLCGWEKTRQSTHGVDGTIGAAFDLISIGLKANYKYSTTSGTTETRQHKVVEGLCNRQSAKHALEFNVEPGHEVYQILVVADLYRVWQVKETGQPFFIEKERSIENRTTATGVRKRVV